MTKTLIFEKKYGVDIADFETTEEVDIFIEKKEGRRLRAVKLDDHGVL
jgi:hypothetical protein